MSNTSGKNLLNETECLKIVCNFLKCSNEKEIKLNRFEIVSTSKNLVGYMGDYFFLELEFTYNNKDMKKEFFLKTIPLNPDSRDIDFNLEAFKREGEIYSTLFVEFAKFSPNSWRPEHYFVGPGVIVMENLISSGFKHFHSTKTFSNECMEVALKSMAEMHASSLIFEYKTNNKLDEICPMLDEDMPLDTVNGWRITGIKSAKLIASLHPKFQSPKYQHFIEEKLSASFEPAFELAKKPKNLRKVFCHRDVWSQNILFKYDEKTSKPTSCVYIDFQIGRYHCPAFDVCLLFYYTTRKSQRDENLEKWFKLYYDHLSHVLEEAKVPTKEILTWDEFRSSADEIKLLPLTIVVLDAILIHLPGEFVMNLKAKEPEKFYNFFNFDRTDLIMEKLKNDEYFKEITFEIIEEFVDCVYSDVK